MKKGEIDKMQASGPLTVDNKAIIAELTAFSSFFFEKSSSYTKLVMGIAYAGFFTAWSGSKSHLGPRALLWSALLITISLVLYLIFEIYQTAVISILGLEFNRAATDGKDVMVELAKFNKKYSAWLRPLRPAWFVIFPTSLITGLAGGFVLIGGFVGAVLRIH